MILLTLSGCYGAHANTRAAPSASFQDPSTGEIGLKVRARPLIYASRCAGLTPDELAEGRAYVHRLVRIEPLYPRSAEFILQQRGVGENPGLVTGAIIYVPAEKGLNRAYLERLLSCHALEPPELGEHPNDPLLAPGIVSVEIEDSDGGEYKITIVNKSAASARDVLARAQALLASPGRVRIEQAEAWPDETDPSKPVEPRTPQDAPPAGSNKAAPELPSQPHQVPSQSPEAPLPPSELPVEPHEAPMPLSAPER